VLGIFVARLRSANDVEWILRGRDLVAEFDRPPGSLRNLGDHHRRATLTDVSGGRRRHSNTFFQVQDVRQTVTIQVHRQIRSRDRRNLVGVQQRVHVAGWNRRVQSREVTVAVRKQNDQAARCCRDQVLATIEVEVRDEQVALPKPVPSMQTAYWRNAAWSEARASIDGSENSIVTAPGDVQQTIAVQIEEPAIFDR